MDKSMMKPFTITGAAMAAVFVGNKVFQHLEKKQKQKNVNDELARLHEQQNLEIKKNGVSSDTTNDAIAAMQRLLK